MRVVELGHRVDELLRVGVFPVGEQGAHVGGLAGEVVIERPLGHAQRVAQGVDPELLRTAIAEQMQAFFQPVVAGEGRGHVQVGLWGWRGGQAMRRPSATNSQAPETGST